MPTQKNKKSPKPIQLSFDFGDIPHETASEMRADNENRKRAISKDEPYLIALIDESWVVK